MMKDFYRIIREMDIEVWRAIRGEIEREEYRLELIASENYVSPAVLLSMGSVLTNKYAEGYPGKRYYGGCEFVDIVEELAIERAKRLFGADVVNVQPHSGSQANMAVYFSVLQPGDTMMGMDLSHGGHLTHGSPVNFSGKLYNMVFYGVEKGSGTIDFTQVRDLAKKHRPKLIIVGGSAYPRIIPFERFREIADETGALLMADIAHPAGLVATGFHPSPVPHCEFITSTTHKTLRGPRGGMVMAREDFGKVLNSRVFPGTQGGPLMHVIAAKAVAFGEALKPDFKDYCRRIIENTKALANTLVEGGLDLVSGGSDTHLILVDLMRTGITGKEAEEALGKAWITVNKNVIPFETRKPFIASGIRIGTPAVTTRGMGIEEMKSIGRWIVRVLENRDNEKVIEDVRNEVLNLCKKFPIYREFLE